MMAQSWTERTCEITNYGRFINHFPPNIIRSIKQFERINKKICRQKVSKEKTEKSTPNDEYENFVNAHLEAAAKYIPTKIKTKYRVPWETLAVREKRASKNYRKNPTNTNALKLKAAQYQLAGIYIKELTEYIQNQIDKIRDSVEDRQSRIA